MPVEKIALISDIHGNLPALEAVLTDIQSRGVDSIICLGDLVGKGPSPAEVTDLIRETCKVVLLGNWDELVATKTGSPWDYHRERLQSHRLTYLSTLPFSLDLHLSGRLVRLFHASAKSIYHRVLPISNLEERIGMFANTPAISADTNSAQPDVVGYGDIHAAFLEHLDDKTLFNVGSVGNPLDMPLASYVILEGITDADANSPAQAPFSIQFVRVAYDIEKSIYDAQMQAMPYLEEYIKELRTAQYRGGAQS